MTIAWDIETCPLPITSFSAAQTRRYEKQLARLLEREPDLDPTQASIKARSLHPCLGYICAIGVIRYHNDTMGTPHVYTAPLPEDEAPMLSRFWADIAKLPRSVLWVTFNGKRFDCDWLALRSLKHTIPATRTDILHNHPYQNRPHTDLLTLVRSPISLDDFCDLSGIPSPKRALNGSGVYEKIKAGHLDDVITYCGEDATATLLCYLKHHAIFPL